MILGPGETGKSKLIAALAEMFEYYETLERLAKAATAGIASSTIKGQTLHSLICLGSTGSKEDWLAMLSEKTKMCQQQNIQGKDFLIINEISMADKMTFFCA